MRKILIIGVKGMLGQELVRVFSADKNHEVFAEEIIEGGELAREIKRQGGNIDKIIAFC